MTFNMDSMPSIADLKRKVAEQKQAQESFKRTVDKNFFPFWEMPEGGQAVVRIMPDGNFENPHTYYIDSLWHRLTIDGEEKRVSCPKTFGNSEDCPICDLSQRYYRDNDKDKGSYYWRKKTSYARVMIITNPLTVNDEDGNPVDFVGRICTTTLGKQIQDALTESLAELTPENALKPICAYEFTIKKRLLAKEDNRDHWTYAFSRITSGPSDIPAEYTESIELIDLKDLLPDRPPLDKVQNYLDAHLGVAEFQFGSNQKNKTEPVSASTVAETAAAAVAAVVAPVAGTVAPVAETAAPVAQTVAPVAGTVAPAATVVSTDAIPDQDLIDGILNRNKG